MFSYLSVTDFLVDRSVLTISQSDLRKPSSWPVSWYPRSIVNHEIRLSLGVIHLYKFLLHLHDLWRGEGVLRATKIRQRYTDGSPVHLCGRVRDIPACRETVPQEKILLRPTLTNQLADLRSQLHTLCAGHNNELWIRDGTPHHFTLRFILIYCKAIAICVVDINLKSAHSRKTNLLLQTLRHIATQAVCYTKSSVVIPDINYHMKCVLVGGKAVVVAAGVVVVGAVVVVATLLVAVVVEMGNRFSVSVQTT